MNKEQGLQKAQNDERRAFERYAEAARAADAARKELEKRRQLWVRAGERVERILGV